MTKRLSRTQINLFWGLLAGDYRLKRWSDGKWLAEFLTDGYPSGGGIGVDPRTVQALICADWINREGRPACHREGVTSNV